MGGDISIESEPGKGTALKFTLRFPRSDTPPAKKTQFEPGMRTHFEISHALVVDDNEINRRILTDMLERSGIGSVYTAPSARRALALLRNLQPDVVFIDLHMPEMDGFQLLEEIKKELGAQGRAMPLTIACTADVGNNKKRQCLNAGFDVHFGKPITGERLSELLNSLGAVSSNNAPPQIDNIELADNQPLLNVERLNEAFIGNEEMTKEFLTLMQSNLPTQMLSIESALNEGALAASSTAAHTLKGLVGYFQNDAIMSQADKLQESMQRERFDEAESTYKMMQPQLQKLLEDIDHTLPGL
jgi:CheY-like chemotaxis protein